MAKRLIRVVMSASKVVKIAYETGKSIIQAVKAVRRPTLDSIFIEGAIHEGKVAVIPSDASERSTIVQRINPLPENLQLIMPVQAVQLAACNQAFREGVMLLWKQNLEDDLFWQAVEDLYSRYSAERTRLGVSSRTVFPESTSSARSNNPGFVIEGSFQDKKSS